MKRLFYTLIFLLLAGTASLAQPRQQQRFERIHAAKVAYLTDRLHFTTQQAEQFWPVYNRYEQEAMDTRRSFMQKYRNTNPGDVDDATAREYIDANLDFQEAIIELKRKYNTQFAKIITPQQLAELYKAEREFKQMLIQQLKDRRGGGKWN